MVLKEGCVQGEVYAMPSATSYVRTLALPVAGMATLWACFRISFYFALLDHGAIAQGQLELLYTLFLASTIVCLLVCSGLEGLSEHILLARPVASSCLAILLFAAFFALSCADCAGGFADAVGCIGSIVAGVGAGCLMLDWSVSLSRLSTHYSSIAIIVAFPLHMLLACALSLADGAAFTVLYLSMPLVSALTWILHQRSQADRFGHESPGLNRRALAALAFSEPVTKRTVTLVVIFVYAGVILWGFLSPEQTGNVSPMQHLVTFAVSGVTFIFLIIGNRRFADKRASSMRTALVVLFIASLFVVLMFGTNETHIGTSTLMAAIFCLEAFAWIVLFGISAHSRHSATRVFGLGLAVLVITPMLLRNIVSPFLFETLGWSAMARSGNTVILVATFLLVVATILFLNSDTSPSEQGKGEARGCRAIVKSHALTAREADVLELLAQGHSQKKISELLYIAPTTVQSHTKAIYRKLGIHTKQELIDLVHECESNGNL